MYTDKRHDKNLLQPLSMQEEDYVCEWHVWSWTKQRTLFNEEVINMVKGLIGMIKKMSNTKMTDIRPSTMKYIYKTLIVLAFSLKRCLKVSALTLFLGVLVEDRA